MEGVDLEWDSTLHHHDDVTTYNDVTVRDDVVSPPQPDLLLSFNDAEKTELPPAKNKEVELLEDIFGEDPSAEGERLKNLLTSSSPHGNASEGAEGSVLLLEGLVKTPPPPPQQFAESDCDVTLRSSCDASPQVKRKSSLERAQQFGNVLD